MDLSQLLSSGQLIPAAFVSFVAGALSFLSPCVLPLVPGYLAYTAGAVTGGAISPRVVRRGGGAGVFEATDIGGAAVMAALAAPSLAEVAGAVNTSRTSAPQSETVEAKSIAAAAAATVSAPNGSPVRASRLRTLTGALLFVAGFTIVFVAGLAAAGTVGSWLLQWQSLITRVMGGVVIVLGLIFAGIFGSFQTTRKLAFKPRMGLAGAPVLGAIFALGWTPCLGPTLATITTLTLQQGSAGAGVLLALVYSLGLGLPFVLVALGFSWASRALAFLRTRVRVINLTGGILLVVIGLLMVFGVWEQLLNLLQSVVAAGGALL